VNKQKNNSYIAIVLAMILWSLSFIWSKLALNTYDPYTILFFRLSIAAITLFILSKSLGLLQKIKKEDYKILLLLSFFEPFLYFIGENFGLEHVSSSTASIIIATIPLFMPIVGFVFFKEALRRRNIIGVFISFFGVLLVVVNKNFSISGELKGFALLFLAVFSALAYTTIIKRVTYKYNVFTIVTWQNIIASIAFFPFFMFYDFDKFNEVGIYTNEFIYIILLAIMASNAAFLLYTYAFKYFRVSQIGLFTNLIPIFTLIVSFFVFNEKLDTIKYFGIVMVIIGLYISEYRKYK
jgi:drug/metabolite transporter (DMT)-like permease